MGHDQQLQVFQPAPPGTRKVPHVPHTCACALWPHALLPAGSIPSAAICNFKSACGNQSVGAIIGGMMEGACLGCFM